jgi:type IV pilus assembly protein PilV
MKTGHPRQRGASLIEALVAMLVLSLGVMGMGAIQTRTLTTARTTNLHALAVQATDDLLDRMQVNADVRLAPDLVNPYVTSWGPPPVSDTNCSSVPCNGAQLAVFDLAQWKSELARSLPAGDASVFISSTDAHQFGVLVAWRETRAMHETTTREEQAALFAQAVAVRDASGGVAGNECPDQHTCHLVYIRP